MEDEERKQSETESKEDKEEGEGETNEDEPSPLSPPPGAEPSVHSSKPPSVSKSENVSSSRLRSGTASARKTLSKMLSSVANAAPSKTKTTGFLSKRNPFIHDPPYPEERRPRIENPRTPKEYIINLREDLADFQESHGLPRTRDYSFMSLGLALAQEIIRALYSLFIMLTELLPIVAIVSLLLRFALDKLIDIFETPELVSKIKKTVIFVAEMILVIIPIWILMVAIVLPLASLAFSVVKRTFHFRRGRRCGTKPKPLHHCYVGFFY